MGGFRFTGLGAPVNPADSVRKQDVWQVIQQQTASAVAQVDFVLPAGFTAFCVELENVFNATDASVLSLRTSTNSGASFHSGASDYVQLSVYSGPTTTPFSTTLSNNSIALSQVVDSTGQMTARYHFAPGNSGTLFQIHGTAIYLADNSGSAVWSIGTFGGIYATVGAQNAIRFISSSGNIASGVFTLLGRA